VRYNVTQKQPPVVTFSELCRAQRFIVAPGTQYTADEPAIIFMRLADEGNSPFNAVSLTSGILSTWLPTARIIPVG